MNCEKATAPIAANVAWQSDTWPEVRTSSPSDRMMIAVVNPIVKYPSFAESTIDGTVASADEHDDARQHLEERWSPPLQLRPVLERGGRHELALRQDEERDEQNDERQASGIPDSHVSDGCSIRKCFDRSAAMPINTPPRNVSGMLGERADCGSTEGLHDEEREGDRVESDERQDEHSRERRERAADDPGDQADADRARRLHRHEVGIVDDRPHRDTGPREAEQEVQQEDHDDADQGDPELRVQDVDVEEPERVERLRQVLVDPNGVRTVRDGREALRRRGSGRRSRRSSTPCSGATGGGRSAP